MRFLTFSELVPNGHVTVTEDDMLYAVELVMVVTSKGRIHANSTLKGVKEEHFCYQKLITKKMPGRGDGRCKLISFENAIELIMVWPGEDAKKYRQKLVDIIKRYLASDRALIGETEANAVSSHPVNQMAREACAADNAMSLEDVRLKHKRDELRLQKMETDMRCNERASLIAERESRLRLSILNK